MIAVAIGLLFGGLAAGPCGLPSQGSLHLKSEDVWIAGHHFSGGAIQYLVTDEGLELNGVLVSFPDWTPKTDEQLGKEWVDCQFVNHQVQSGLGIRDAVRAYFALWDSVTSVADMEALTSGGNTVAQVVRAMTWVDSVAFSETSGHSRILNVRLHGDTLFRPICLRDSSSAGLRHCARAHQPLSKRDRALQVLEELLEETGWPAGPRTTLISSDGEIGGDFYMDDEIRTGIAFLLNGGNPDSLITEWWSGMGRRFKRDFTGNR